MSGPIGDPQGTQARAIDAERRHPTAVEQPPGPFRRNQLIVLAMVVGLPLLAYGIKYWL